METPGTEDIIVSEIFTDQKCLSCQTTRIVELKDPNNRESYLKNALIELILHMFFLIMIIYISDNSSYKLVYDINSSISHLFVHTAISETNPFVTFNNISSHKELWDYLMHCLLDGLYWNIDNEGRKLSDQELGYILYRNQMKYNAQLRQVRSIKALKPTLEKTLPPYLPYSKSTSNKSYISFSMAGNFSTSNPLGFLAYFGRTSIFGSEGYTYSLPNNKMDAYDSIIKLNNESWINPSTRALFIEFILFNNDLLNYVFVRLAVEFPPSGGVFTSSEIDVIRIFKYNPKNMDVMLVTTEILYTLFILYYLFIIFIEVSAFGGYYFLSFTSIMDLIIVFVSLFYVSIVIYVSIRTYQLNDRTLESKVAVFLGKLFVYSDTAISIVFCLAFIKLFKYLNFNSTLWSLSKTIYICSKDLVSLFILSSCIYLAFTMSGSLFFGYQYEEFSSFYFALASMLRILLGDMNFTPFKVSVNYLSFIFVLFFEALIYCLFLGLFLAIVLNAYSAVGLLHQKQKFEMQMLEYTYRKIAQLFRKKYNEPPLISVKEWVRTMMDLGHPVDAAQIVINKYKDQGISKSSFLTYPQQDELTYELEYYLKSSYMRDKLKILTMAFEKLRNLLDLKLNPVPKTSSIVRNPTLLTKLTNDILDAEKISEDKRERAYNKISLEISRSPNLLEPYNRILN